MLAALPSLPKPASSPASPVVRTVASTAWLDRLNAWRVSTGVPTLAENTSWSSGDYAHAVYMVKNNLVTHYETPGTPYYTAAGDLAAQKSNIYVSSSTSTTDPQAIDWWMQAPFHALGLMDPRLSTTGFGSYREVKSGWQLGAAVDVIRGNSFSGGTYPVYFPGNGTQEPLTSYDGYESPNPLSACSGYSAPSGLPVFVQLGGNVSTVAGAVHSFTGNGTPLDHCVIDSTNSTLGSSLKMRGAVILIPRRPLQTGVTYTVALYVNSRPYTWSFTVGPFNACSSVSVTPAPPSPSVVGATVTVTATAAGCPNLNPLYRFSLFGPSGGGYQQVQAYSTNPVFSWSTAGLAPGAYRFSVWARDANSNGAYGNSSGRWDTYNNATVYTLNSCTSLNVTAAPPSPHEVGTTITISAAATCPSPLYRFWLLAPGANGYQMVQDYSASPNFNWITTGNLPGTYRFAVWVRDTNSPGEFGNASGRWDLYNNNTVYTLSSCTSLGVSSAPGTSAASGTTVTVTASAVGCSSPLYRFSLLAPGGASYVMVRDYSSTATFTWTTTGLTVGAYRFSVWAKDSTSGGASGNASGRWDTYNNSAVYNLT